MRGRTGSAVAALVLTAVSLAPSAVEADTPGCATHKEYRHIHTLMSTGSVSNLLDTNGWFIGDKGLIFKRGYKACWAPKRKKVVVAYAITTSLSVWKDVRDR